MLRDYRKGQRLSGATIQRLFRDYWKRAARENRAAFLIVDELAVANQWGKAHS